MRSMKKIIALLAGVFAGSAGADTAHHEASTGFDLEQVRPFLAQLNTSLHLGLDVETLGAFTESIEIDQEKRLELSVEFNGQTSDLVYQVYMDDVDAPDLYFFSDDEELITAIQTEMNAFPE